MENNKNIPPRYILSTSKQASGESVEEFVQKLVLLSKDCNFIAVSVEKAKKDAIRDAFISGLSSNIIRQRLIENKMLDLDDAIDQAKSIDRAVKNSELYQSKPIFTAAIQSEESISNSTEIDDGSNSNVAIIKFKHKCYYCGFNKHSRNS